MDHNPDNVNYDGHEGPDRLNFRDKGGTYFL